MSKDNGLRAAVESDYERGSRHGYAAGRFAARVDAAPPADVDAETLAEVLARHMDSWPIEEGFGYTVGWHCECGAKVHDYEGDLDPRKWHTEHVANVFALRFHVTPRAEGEQATVCSAQYGGNPDLCYLPVGHREPHSNRYGCTWAEGKQP
jgi:hypothetical protein